MMRILGKLLYVCVMCQLFSFLRKVVGLARITYWTLNAQGYKTLVCQSKVINCN